ncbi:MAG TPA: hypothetical protein VHD56_11585 [Tepidisphaeraceae bacterium]|nr:hypothetical protein [Tepidisphaeraceae bacterium]
MELKDEADVARTRELEFHERYDAVRDDPNESERLRRLTMMSLKRQINQFIEDIARYESRLHQV